jgi:hypothetical protein
VARWVYVPEPNWGLMKSSPLLAREGWARFVAPFPGPGGKWQISTAGGSKPRWRGDGKEIFYLAPDNKLMVAAVDGKGSSFEVGAVKPLFQTSLTGQRAEYDVSADGERFLMIASPEQATSTPITVVLNWTAGFKK